MKINTKNIGKIIISLTIVLFFASCTTQNIASREKETNRETNKNPEISNTELLDAIESAKESEKKVNLELINTTINEKEVSIEVVLKNPESAPINSVQSFLAFNPKSLKGENISFPDKSPFELIAPGENEFDNENGIVKIGISSTETINDQEIVIAKVSFERIDNNFTTIDFYDVRQDGHTKVLGLFRGHIKNILNEPAVPAISIEAINKETE